MVRINWTNLAVDDLKNIAEYTVAKYSVAQGKTVINAIRLKVETLKTVNIGGTIDGIKDDSIRQIPEGLYKIIYKTISPEQIDILTVYETTGFNKRNVF